MELCVELVGAVLKRCTLWASPPTQRQASLQDPLPGMTVFCYSVVFESNVGAAMVLPPMVLLSNVLPCNSATTIASMEAADVATLSLLLRSFCHVAHVLRCIHPCPTPHISASCCACPCLGHGMHALTETQSGMLHVMCTPTVQKPDSPAHAVCTLQFYTAEELTAIEAETDRVNAKAQAGLLPAECFHVTAGKSGSPKRTKFFFGARYLWTREQMSSIASARRAHGVRVDVPAVPSWIQVIHHHTHALTHTHTLFHTHSLTQTHTQLLASLLVQVDGRCRQEDTATPWHSGARTGAPLCPPLCAPRCVAHHPIHTPVCHPDARPYAQPLLH